MDTKEGIIRGCGICYRTTINHKITFQYAVWTVKKDFGLKHDGEYYIVSPWALTWDDENYYLIAFDEKDSQIKHYRVDKMIHMDMIKEERLGREHFMDFDLAAFSKKTFDMYGGRDETVTLECHNDLAVVVIDRIGNDIMISPVNQTHFHVNVLVSVSRQFFGWVTGIGRMMQVTRPESVSREYREYLLEILTQYKSLKE